jgi:hypothetical protein
MYYNLIGSFWSVTLVTIQMIYCKSFITYHKAHNNVYDVTIVKNYMNVNRMLVIRIN